MKHRVGRTALYLALTWALAGCGHKSSGHAGSGTPGQAAICSNDPGFSSPFDAAPSPDGKKVWFTAVGPNGAGVFLCGTTATTVADGDPFVTPFGIAVSEDGKTLFVADPGAEDATADLGEVFSVPSSGGAPTALTGAAGLRPKAIAVAGKDVFFSGKAADGTPGLYKMDEAGATAVAVSSGNLLDDVTGIAVDRAETVAYLVDSVASGLGRGQIVKVDLATGNQSVLTAITDIRTGFPAGIALSNDESALLVSALDDLTETDAVYRVDLAAGTSSALTLPAIAGFGESAGLHRAANAEVYAWADSQAMPAGSTGTGTVFLLSN
jgi:DNA-binding beta-propeller fold protein YncE